MKTNRETKKTVRFTDEEIKMIEKYAEDNDNIKFSQVVRELITNGLNK
ncbi:hypothetical protein [Bacillus sp. AFS002410]|nr:hypothetical protein [Bacillus sp. AFS002410]